LPILAWHEQHVIKISLPIPKGRSYTIRPISNIAVKLMINYVGCTHDVDPHRIVIIDPAF